jgi:hypothetical protein
MILATNFFTPSMPSSIKRIVLAIRWNGVKPERVFDLALEQGPFVEGDDDVFVGLGHGLSPPSAHPSQCYAGRFSAVVSTGSFRRRLPVAAKIALATAGTIAEVPGSPIPPGGSELWTIWTSMAGASFMRSIW